MNKNSEWRIYTKKLPFHELAEELGVRPLLVRLMANRGLTTVEEMRYYLFGGLQNLPSPFLLPDIQPAIERIRRSMERDELIFVAGDYDTDGVFSSEILREGLSFLNLRIVSDAPDRIEEGYGLNERMVDDAIRDGAGLLVTCDNGISCFRQIAYAKEKGLDVIVTDHHEIPVENGKEKLPDCLSCINPHRSDSEFPYESLCGAGVAWFFISALYRVLIREDKIQKKDAEDMLLHLLPYAAIATVADVMPLTRENRILVKEGLKRIRNVKNLGLQALIRLLNLPDEILSEHIGFRIGPCFNAAGRLASSETARKLLQAETEEEAEALAAELYRLNDDRKQKTEAGVREAVRLIRSGIYDEDRVLVLFLPDLHESIAGIVAGRIRELYCRPTLVITRAKEGLKGSGRSIPAYSMFEKLTEASAFLTRFGGHPMAAGFSLEEENLDAFRIFLNEHAHLSDADITERVWIDFELPLEEANASLIDQTDALQPVGTMNPSPLFAASGVAFFGKKLGESGRTLRFRLRRDGEEREFIHFGEIDEELSVLSEVERNRFFGREGLPVHLTYTVEWNEFRGEKKVQLKAEGLRFARRKG